MVKKVTLTVDENLADMMKKNNHPSEDMLTDALKLYFQQQKDENISRFTTNDPVLLRDQIDILEKEKQELEIEKTCLMQENHSLQTRINDLSELYPSASILLGTKPTIKQKNPIAEVKNKLFKRK